MRIPRRSFARQREAWTTTLSPVRTAPHAYLPYTSALAFVPIPSRLLCAPPLKQRLPSHCLRATGDLWFKWWDCLCEQAGRRASICKQQDELNMKEGKEGGRGRQVRRTLPKSWQARLSSMPGLSPSTHLCLSHLFLPPNLSHTTCSLSACTSLIAGG